PAILPTAAPAEREHGSPSLGITTSELFHSSISFGQTRSFSSVCVLEVAQQNLVTGNEIPAGREKSADNNFTACDPEIVSGATIPRQTRTRNGVPQLGDFLPGTALLAEAD